MAEEQSGGAPQATAPEPFSLAGALDGFDMEVDSATGELMFVPTQQQRPAAGTQDAPPAPAGGTATPPAPAAGDDISPDANDPATLVKRLKDTQAALTKANQARAEAERKFQESEAQFEALNLRVDSVMDMIERNRRGPRPDAEPAFGELPPEDGFESPQHMKAYLDSQIEKRAREIIQTDPAYKHLSQEFQIRSELQEAVEAHGEDFLRNAEEVRKVINLRPELSFKQAFEILKQFGKVNTGNSNQAPNVTPTPTGAQPSANPTAVQGGAVDRNAGGNDDVDAVLADRARRLGNVEHPSLGASVGKGPVKSVRDAMERAFEELYGS